MLLFIGFYQQIISSVLFLHLYFPKTLEEKISLQNTYLMC